MLVSARRRCNHRPLCCPRGHCSSSRAHSGSELHPGHGEPGMGFHRSIRTVLVHIFTLPFSRAHTRKLFMPIFCRTNRTRVQFTSEPDVLRVESPFLPLFDGFTTCVIFGILPCADVHGAQADHHQGPPHRDGRRAGLISGTCSISSMSHVCLA